jgi:hypothetical protein
MMQLPFTMPAAQRRVDHSVVCRMPADAALNASRNGIEAAGCCAEACVDTPLGRVCRCLAESSLC